MCLLLGIPNTVAIVSVLKVGSSTRTAPWTPLFRRLSANSWTGRQRQRQILICSVYNIKSKILSKVLWSLFNQRVWYVQSLKHRVKVGDNEDFDSFVDVSSSFRRSLTWTPSRHAYLCTPNEVGQRLKSASVVNNWWQFRSKWQRPAITLWRRGALSKHERCCVGSTNSIVVAPAGWRCFTVWVPDRSLPWIRCLPPFCCGARGIALNWLPLAISTEYKSWGEPLPSTSVSPDRPI